MRISDWSSECARPIFFARRGAAEEAFETQQWAARTGLDETLAMAESERAAATDSDLGTKVAERRQLLAARQGLEARIDANLARPDPAFDLAAVTAELDEIGRASCRERVCQYV